jgi:hypothetical protein
MVVCYFYVIGVTVFPVKADSPLIVDPDTVLTLAVAFKAFEPVARRDSEILKMPGPVKVQKLTPYSPLDRTKLRNVLIIE